MIKKITFKYGPAYSERFGRNGWVAGIFDDSFNKTDYYFDSNNCGITSITDSFTDNWEVTYTKYKKSDFYDVTIWLTMGPFLETITLQEVVSPTREELLEFFNNERTSNEVA